jgi:hypothetical protein
VESVVKYPEISSNLRGILAPALTAVTDDFQIHPELTIAHYKWLLANGCDGLVVFGTTSEANSFSVAERKRFLEQAVGAGIDPKNHGRNRLLRPFRLHRADESCS